MRSIRARIPVKLLLLIFFSVCQIPGVAKAQNINLRGKFRLQNEVHWGKAVLPAGEYSLTVDSRMSPQDTIYAIVRSTDGRKVAIATVSGTGKPEPGGSYALFISDDGTPRIRLLNLPEQSVSFTFGPMSKRDREEMHAIRTEAVPMVAEK